MNVIRRILGDSKDQLVLERQIEENIIDGGRTEMDKTYHGQKNDKGETILNYVVTFGTCI